jgi:acyl-CoA-binding protein
MTDGIKNIEHPGATDSNGTYKYTWTIDPNSKPGLYKVTVNVTLPGYQPSFHETNFQVQPRQLLVQVNFSKGAISPGDSQSIAVKAVDAKSFKQIPGAKVQVRMTDGIKNIEHPGATDSNGTYKYTWTIDPNSKPGLYKVATDVSAAGYRPIIENSNFQIRGNLLAQVSLAKGLVNPGDSQGITIKILDAVTKQKIANANVSGIISGSKKFLTATNVDGQAAYEWIVSPISGDKSYNITLDVSHDKYSSLSKFVTFKTGKALNLLGPPEQENVGSNLKINPTLVTKKDQCKETSANGQLPCNENSLSPKTNGLVAFRDSTSSRIFG